jgi:hypothetical protein
MGRHAGRVRRIATASKLPASAFVICLPSERTLPTFRVRAPCGFTDHLADRIRLAGPARVPIPRGWLLSSPSKDALYCVPDTRGHDLEPDVDSCFRTTHLEAAGTSHERFVAALVGGPGSRRGEGPERCLPWRAAAWCHEVAAAAELPQTGLTSLRRVTIRRLLGR